MTKCEIDNDVDCYSFIEELCIGSGKKYEDLKEELSQGRAGTCTIFF